MASSCCAHTIGIIYICATSRQRASPTLTARKKKVSTKNSAFTKFKYVAEGRNNRDRKNSDHSCQGRSYSSTLGARCVCSGERQRYYGGRWNSWWGCAECCVQEQLRCDCGTVTSTVEAPTGVCATAESKSDTLCCSSTSVDHNPWICAWHLYFK